PPRRKPPLHTTTEPDLRRSAYVDSLASISAPVTAVDTSPRVRTGFSAPLQDRPPTTNYLHPQERADLVRKSRKLTQLLGETPSLSVTPLRIPRRVSDELSSHQAGRHHPRPSWASQPSVRSADFVDNLHGHRMSSTAADRLSVSELSLAEGMRAGMGKTGDKGIGATDVVDSTSFIDLSDDDNQPTRALSPHSIPSPPRSCPPDLQDVMLHPRSPEEDRRRRREKIAKLHRFLGSRVPTSLVLGFSAADDTLPTLDPTASSVPKRHPDRRRSSSVAEFKSNWFDPDDRLKEELDGREKAINVRRAVKMEKMFGVQPPQTLFHTRLSPRPKDRVPLYEPPSFSEHEAVLPANRNINKGSYLNKGSGQRLRTTSRSESVVRLLSPELDNASGRRASAAYMHYRYSLDSLGDIIERDDRASLVELHSILTDDQSGVGGPTTLTHDDSKTVLSGRRNSLPSRSSTVSLASQFNSGSPSPQMTSFQTRRRQAAKLTHFFGVDYRDLIGDILESIEHCVEEESHRGGLHPEEIQDLMVKLRKLRTRRTPVI
ncbi:hypothetical protein F5148DRAFT_974712, partial [Russula earlei]